MKNQNNNNEELDISRKEAIKKMGKYAALTALGTFIWEILTKKQLMNKLKRQ